MKASDFIINRLEQEGTEYAFVVNGAADANLIDAFNRTKRIKHIAVMHEQAGGFAAEAYAKISGKLGLAIATSGPGGHNLVAAIGNCFYDSTPCLFLTGQVNSQFVRPDENMRQLGFQETPIAEIVRPITKYSKMVSKPSEVRYELEKAIHLATSGRPGPVLLDFPMDVQRADISPDSVGFDKSSVRSFSDQSTLDSKIEKFLEDLSNSERPAMIIGGGVRLANAVPEFLEVARKLKIPCYPTWNALDVVTSDMDVYGGRIGTYGGPGRNFGVQNSDLLLLIGSRLSGRITGGNVGSFARGAKKYALDVDESLMQRNYQQVPFDENILADAKTFFDRLSRRLDSKPIRKNFSQWLNRNREWVEKYDPVNSEQFNSEKLNPYAFMEMLSRQTGQWDVIVGDCGGNLVLASQALKLKQGQRFISSNGNSPMGFSFAGAIGAYLANPLDVQNNTICLIGDGGFNMNLQELQTLKTYNLPIKTFIINNGVYGIIRAYQRTNLESRFLASGPEGYVPPNFEDICRAYKIETESIETTREAPEKIRRVLDSDKPVVCNVNLLGFDNYDPRVSGWRTPIEDMEPYLPREEFRAQMIIPPLPGWEKASY